MGYLFLVVGPSGAGKDTLIDYVTIKLPVIKVKRYITRLPNAFEDFISVSVSDFNKMDFFLKWGSYDKQYGISAEVLSGLKSDRHFIINVSRDVISEAKSKWAKTFVISLSVSKEVLVKRALERGRDSPEEIKKRLDRDFTVSADFTVDSSNPDASVAGDKIVGFIKKLIS